MARRPNEFETREGLADALARTVARDLGEAVAARGRACLAVSGGSTPVAFFRQLSGLDVDWPKVTVTLVDERFGPQDHERSNARLVQENLLLGKAAAARFVPLYRAGTPEDAAQAATGALAQLLPIDVLVLGMGTDGHTASLFADAEGADALLTRRPGDTVVPVRAPSAVEPRLTLSLDAISRARSVYLHIEGSEKRAVLSEAAERRLPIAAVLEAADRPVTIYWAP